MSWYSYRKAGGGRTRTEKEELTEAWPAMMEQWRACRGRTKTPSNVIEVSGGIIDDGAEHR
jgi:hypothetical protein